jgi:hypothetical protein
MTSHDWGILRFDWVIMRIFLCAGLCENRIHSQGANPHRDGFSELIKTIVDRLPIS